MLVEVFQVDSASAADRARPLEFLSERVVEEGCPAGDDAQESCLVEALSLDQLLQSMRGQGKPAQGRRRMGVVLTQQVCVVAQIFHDVLKGGQLAGKQLRAGPVRVNEPTIINFLGRLLRSEQVVGLDDYTVQGHLRQAVVQRFQRVDGLARSNASTCENS